MIEFVGLPYEVAMETMHFHVAHTISFQENFVSHSEGPTEQFGMNLKGPRSGGYIVP